MKVITGIYKITNLINNKIYIGQSINVLSRWQEHKRDRHSAIYSDICKYGFNNFSFEILEQCPYNKLILNEREKYWINYYGSYLKGYNKTTGGQSGYNLKGREVYVFNEFGILNKKYQSVAEAARAYNMKTATLAKRCCSNKIYNHIIFSFKSVIDINFYEKAKRYKNCIYQYDLSNNLICKYDSLKEVIKLNPTFSQSGIYNVLEKRNNGSSCGFRWSYSLDALEDYKLNYKTKKIKQFNLFMEKIGEYNSIKEAENVTKISSKNICAALKKKIKTSGNFYWFYEDEEPVFTLSKKQEKAILQYDLRGNLIKEYSSIKKAALENRVNACGITNVAKGRRKTAGGFVWKYKT